MSGPVAVLSLVQAARRGEERGLFEQLRAGDPSAREALVRRFLPLAHKLARGYSGGVMLRALAPRERQILELRFHEDLTQSQIGERLGVSQMLISRTIRASIAVLQRAAS